MQDFSYICASIYAHNIQKEKENIFLDGLIRFLLFLQQVYFGIFGTNSRIVIIFDKQKLNKKEKNTKKE